MRLALSTLVFCSFAAVGADRLTLGLTRSGAPIDAYSVPAARSFVRKVIIAGPTRIVRQEIQKWESQPERKRSLDVLGLMLPENVPLHFPPEGKPFRDNPESHAVWRWILSEAPDLVLISGDDSSGLAQALAATGQMPARSGSLASIKGKLDASPAQVERERRMDRSPRDMAQSLGSIYGQEFKDVSYIGAVALMARLRLGSVAEVERLAAPYRESASALPAKPGDAAIGGHLVFAALAALTGDARYTELARKAADAALAGPLHNEMSDAVLMECPLLAEAGKLTGEKRYFDAAAGRLDLIRKLCLRRDGLYSHSPLADAAWGRGNGFVALGAALMLESLPADHPAYEEAMRGFQNHMAALARDQNEQGMWLQLIDRPGAWPELSATAMIATAMLRGVKAGWLDGRSYSARIERAWKAVSARTADDGALSGVCESTGKLNTVEEYLRRVAIDGRDARGGAMVLFFATEMAGYR